LSFINSFWSVLQLPPAFSAAAKAGSCNGLGSCGCNSAAIVSACARLHRTLLAQLHTTFVYAQWWAFENAFVPRDQTLKEDINL